MLHLGSFRHGRAVSGGSATPDWPARFFALAEAARDARMQAFYAAAAVPPETPISAAPLLALDLETTGLDPRRDEIVSIGVVPMSLERIRTSDSRHWIVRPRRAMNGDSVTFHGITHSQVSTAPDFEQILGELLEILAGQVMVVHCRAVERCFLDAALRERIGESLEFPVIDTMELEARAHRLGKPGLLARFFGRRPVSLRLADSRARYGLPRYRAHHAPTDALASAELLQAQVAHHYAPQTPLRALWQ